MDAPTHEGAAGAARQPAAPAAPTPVVLLHGVTDSGACWSTTAARLAPSRPVLAPSMLGHGGREAPEVFAISALAADVAATLDAWGRGPAVLVGHSMGGLVAEELALTRPGVVAGLVLVDPAWRPRDARDGRPEWLAALVAEARSATLAEVVERSRREHPRWDDGEHLPWAEAKRAVHPALATIPHDWHEREWVEAMAGLAAARVPVTLVTGDEALGAIVSPATAARVDALLRATGGVTVAHLAGAGHSVHRDRPDAFGDVLDVALAKVDAARGAPRQRAAPGASAGPGAPARLGSRPPA